MSDLAAIRATFHTWRPAMGRKQLQLIFEVPLEQQEVVLRMLGAPRSDDPQWCAIALLREEVVSHSERQASGQDNAPPPVNLERRRQLFQQAKERYRQAPEWQKAAMRASILCGDVQFQKWLRFQTGRAWPQGLADIDAAAYKLRGLLGITSRSEIGTDREVYDRFIALETQYKFDTNQMAEVRD